MRTDIARHLALTIAGNSALGGRSVRTFWPDSIFFYREEVCKFSDKDGTYLADDPLNWIDGLKGNCKGLWLHCVGNSNEDRSDSGFANSGARWLIETVHDHGSALWEGVALESKNDDRAWETHYVRIAINWRKTRPPIGALPALIGELDQVLLKIGDFARSEHIDNFASIFESARAELHHPTTSPLVRDVSQFADLQPEAKALLASLSTAWVFGGMGSWNDMSFSGERGQVYDAVSEELFRKLKEAIVHVANSTFPRVVH